MSLSRTRREVTHERILDVAARDVRRKGYAGVGVADVMAQAGLTHGGFYAHFESRDAMLAEAIERAGKDSGAGLAERIEVRRGRGVSAFRALVEQYLSPAHVASVERGCVVAALASEMPRQSAALRKTSAERVRGLVALIKQSLPTSASKSEAPVIAATLVGTLQLARTLGPDGEGKALLAAARRALIDRYDAG
jgi:Transcriptional regulator